MALQTNLETMNPQASKRKGASAEIAACKWLNDNYGWPTTRIHLAGKHDLGDIAGVTGLCIEVKSSNLVRPPWREWWKQTVREAKNAGQPNGVCFYRPPRTPNPDDWLVLFDWTQQRMAGVDWSPMLTTWNATMKAARVLAAEQDCAGPVGAVDVESGVGCVEAPMFFTWWAEQQS